MTAKKIFSKLEITPDKVLAGDSEEIVIRLTIGPDYTPGKSRIIFDLASTLGTSCPTFRMNEESGYAEVYVSNPEVEYTKNCWDLDHQVFVGPENAPSREATRFIVIDLSSGLKAGDTVELHWGETTGGFGPGAKITTVVPSNEHDCKIYVRYFEGKDKGLPDLGGELNGYSRPTPDAEESVTYRVIPREAKRLRLLRKTDRAMLIPYDRFWNVAETESANELVESDAQGEDNGQGVYEYTDKNINLKSRTLPLSEAPAMDNVFEGMNIYWGDIHTHSAFSIDCIQRARMEMTPDELMTFARDRTGLDFYAVTDHHQPQDDPTRHLSPTHWERTMEAVEKNNQDGRFTVFPGIEYRCPRGDTCVIFNWIPEHKEIEKPEWKNISALWKGLAGKDYITIPHLHNTGSLPENEWPLPENFANEPVLELFSDHGSYEREHVLESARAWCKRFRPDRNAEYFLQNGPRYGFVANSDGHKGHVGMNGLTAVYSESLDRDSLIDAYRKRRVYATTNARIRMLFTVNGALMGSEIPFADKAELFIDVQAEAPLKMVDLFKDGKHYRRFATEGKNFTENVSVECDNPASLYVRATQIDNHVAWSSPVWIG